MDDTRGGECRREQGVGRTADRRPLSRQPAGGGGGGGGGSGGDHGRSGLRYDGVCTRRREVLLRWRRPEAAAAGRRVCLPLWACSYYVCNALRYRRQMLVNQI